MAEDKANQKPKYRFSVERLAKYMPADLNDKQAEEYVLKALTHYKKHLDRIVECCCITCGGLSDWEIWFEIGRFR